MIARYSTSTEGIYIDKNLTDVVKMLACVMVALHHYSAYVISVDYNNNIVLQAFSTQGGYLGVALFFFMSGFGLMMSEKRHHLNCFPFLKKRLSKVLIPSIIVTIIWLPIFYVMHMRGGNSLNDNDLHRELWHWGDDVMWFVKTLTLQYLFFSIYSFFRQTRPHYKSLVLIIITIASFFISYSVVLRHAISLPLFYLGIWIADNPSLSRKLLKSIVVPSGLILLMLATCYIGRHNAMILHILFNYIVVLIALIALSLFRISISNLPSIIGQGSFDVYLVHNKVIMSMRHIWGVFPLWSFMLATIITTIIFGYFRVLKKSH